MYIHSLHVFPIKSCKGISLKSVHAGRTGKLPIPETLRGVVLATRLPHVMPAGWQDLMKHAMASNSMILFSVTAWA